MKRSKFTEQEVACTRKQAELGTPGEEVCPEIGIGKATFYDWKKKQGRWGPTEPANARVHRHYGYAGNTQ